MRSEIKAAWNTKGFREGLKGQSAPPDDANARAIYMIGNRAGKRKRAEELAKKRSAAA